MSTEGYSGDQRQWNGLDLAQQKKLAWVANRKRVALVDVDIETVPVNPRCPQSWLVRGPGARRNSPEATDIHDNDPTDPVYGWDWDEETATSSPT